MTNVKNTFVLNPNKSILCHFKSLFVMLFICGLNYQVFKINRIIKVLFYLYCMFLISAATYATTVCCPNVLIQTWALIEYVLSVTFLLIFNSRLPEFAFDLFKIDSSLRINTNNYKITNTRIFIITIVLWLFRLAFTVIYCLCYQCYSNMFLYIISLISPFILDLNRVWRYILVDMIRSRLHTLRLRLNETPGCNFYLHISDNKMLKEDKIRFCLNIYRRISDTVDSITPELHASIFSSIICSIPKLIIHVYHILLVVEKIEPLETIGFLAMHIIQVCFFLCSPCIVIELYAIEVEKLRLSLIHQFIGETDSRVKEDIQLFLQYAEMRQFQSKIWRFIPVNIALPIEVANLCGSFIIVLLNFTHLFG